MSRNPYAKSLRVHRAQVVPDKREKTFREHLTDTLNEEIPERFTRLIADLS